MISTVDPATGAMARVTSVGLSGMYGRAFGIDFDPVTDRLRIVSTEGTNLRVNVETGETISDGRIKQPITGYGYGYNNVAYSNPFARGCRTTLFAIDIESDQLVILNPNTGVSTLVGALGFDTTAVIGFDIATDGAGGNTALAILVVGATTELYSINLLTGVASSTGVIDTEGTSPIGFALKSLPPSESCSSSAPE